MKTATITITGLDRNGVHTELMAEASGVDDVDAIAEAVRKLLPRGGSMTWAGTHFAPSTVSTIIGEDVKGCDKYQQPDKPSLQEREP